MAFGLNWFSAHVAAFPDEEHHGPMLGLQDPTLFTARPRAVPVATEGPGVIATQGGAEGGGVSSRSPGYLGPRITPGSLAGGGGLNPRPIAVTTGGGDIPTAPTGAGGGGPIPTVPGSRVAKWTPAQIFSQVQTPESYLEQYKTQVDASNNYGGPAHGQFGFTPPAPIDARATAADFLAQNYSTGGGGVSNPNTVGDWINRAIKAVFG